MGTRENKNAKIANLRTPRKFKPAKIRARTVSVVCGHVLSVVGVATVHYFVTELNLLHTYSFCVF